MTASGLTGNTKRTLQELSKVFNRLASELNTELGHARAEIENLRKEINRLRAINGSKSGSSSRSVKTTRKPTGPVRGSAKSGGRTNKKDGSGQSSHRNEKQSNTVIPTSDSEYIFPREPFNPPAPSEPSPPNN